MSSVCYGDRLISTGSRGMQALTTERELCGASSPPVREKMDRAKSKMESFF